jgi:hypothetical protein
MKRLALLATAAAAASAVLAPSALADGLPLASSSTSAGAGSAGLTPSLTTTVGQAADSTTSALAGATGGQLGARQASPTDTVGQAVTTLAAPATQTVETAISATAPVAATVTQTAAPLMETVTEPVTSSAAPLLQTVEKTAQAVTGPAAPLVQTVAGANQSSAGSNASGSTSSPEQQAEPATQSSDSWASATSPAQANAAPKPVSRGFIVRDELGNGVRGRTDTHSARPLDFAPPPMPPATDPPLPTSSERGGSARGLTRHEIPLPPHDPGPLGLLGAVLSSGAGSGMLLLVAALSAILALAAPRPGRRLRPGSAPWPLPTLHLPLERPG